MFEKLTLKEFICLQTKLLDAVTISGVRHGVNAEITRELRVLWVDIRREYYQRNRKVGITND